MDHLVGLPIEIEHDWKNKKKRPCAFAVRKKAEEDGWPHSKGYIHQGPLGSNLFNLISARGNAWGQICFCAISHTCCHHDLSLPFKGCSLLFSPANILRYVDECCQKYRASGTRFRQCQAPNNRTNQDRGMLKLHFDVPTYLLVWDYLTKCPVIFVSALPNLCLHMHNQSLVAFECASFKHVLYFSRWYVFTNYLINRRGFLSKD